MKYDIDHIVQKIPEEFRERIRSDWQTLCKSNFKNIRLDTRVIETLPLVWMASEYASKICLRDTQLFSELASHDLSVSYGEGHYQDILTERLLGVSNEEELQHELRVYRQREMLRIIWRDIAGWSDLNETIQDLSHFAEACLDCALTRLHSWQCDLNGTPKNQQGKSIELVILGMGKLGAWELNLSSDIDLIFCYAQDGVITKGEQKLSHSEFFTRLAKKLIQALDANTHDGFVFRVDMRLRPFGESGPLVCSFNAMEHYYQSHGREWERYAMIKARVVAGDQDVGKTLITMLRPFVYRRYIDYGVYDALREMKAMIAREVKLKSMEQNVKLGSGGIREIEFIGQVFQLIRGGRDKHLTARKIQKVLHYLGAADYLPQYVVDELLKAYIFLRNVEHRLQAWADQQTHLLPSDATAQLRLAYSLGYESWQLFYAELEQHRSRVQRHFDQVFEAPQTELEDDGSIELLALWNDVSDESVSLALLLKLGYTEAQKVLNKIRDLRNSRTCQSLSVAGQKRLERLMPLLIGAAAQANDNNKTILRLLDLLEIISKRSVYLSLLVENPIALSQLVKLTSASPWIIHYLQHHPLLLDELLDPRTLYRPPDKQVMQNELRKKLQLLDENDEERALDEMRHFKHGNVLRIAAADIVEALPLKKVSDHLTWVAECILDEALELSWRHLVARHGRPPCAPDAKSCGKGFAVIAYGKLGGIELGYGSDLDLVFLYGQPEDKDMTDGATPVSVPVFYARLGQRLIHILSAFTSAGSLYEIDMRLRPDGASGMLVSNVKAFSSYQKKKAWLWEHQALVRARMVAGDSVIGDEFNAIRHDVLTQKNVPEELRLGIVEMREKMRTNLDKSTSNEIDIKQGRGGLVDIEFLVQYLILNHAHKTPQLLEYTDNIRMLEKLVSTDILDMKEGEFLIDTYQTQRNTTHRQSLAETKGNVTADYQREAREEVIRLWQNKLEIQTGVQTH